MPDALSITKPSDREVEITRAFDAPKKRVFDAFTRPDLVKRWLLGPPGWTMPVCEIDPKAGGKLRYEWRNANDGREMGMNGVFREFEPPSRTVHTEIFDEDWTGGETVVTTLFKEVGGKTTVSMTVLYGSQKARDAALGTGMTRGMEESYARLDEMLVKNSA
jgi:uncharacterized protein YndB with AHSA1/START domain